VWEQAASVMAFFIIQDLFCLELRDSWGLQACSKQHASLQMRVRMPGWSLVFGRDALGFN
jgi:hypothetical protein